MIKLVTVVAMRIGEQNVKYSLKDRSGFLFGWLGFVCFLQDEFLKGADFKYSHSDLPFISCLGTIIACPHNLEKL